MADRIRITAIVGSYRKGGVIDQVVEELLASARDEGAETTAVYLADTSIEFCTNCRVCTQTPGSARGICPIGDEMAGLLELLERSDALVLASPVNFGGVTALMKRFIERLVCFAYWPWGSRGPDIRDKRTPRRAVIVASSAAPAFLTRLMTPTGKLLAKAAGMLGAKTVGTLYVGLAAMEREQEPGARVRKKARLLGRKLAAGRGQTV